MKAHAMYEEVHNFLKGKAPLFEKELALIRNTDGGHHHHMDMGDSFLGGTGNSRKSSMRAAVAAVAPTKYQEKRSWSREEEIGDQNPDPNNNRQRRINENGVGAGLAPYNDSNRIREVREDAEETLINETQGEDTQILEKYRKTDAYQRLLKRQEQAVRRLERIKANFEKKRKQVTMLSVQRTDQAGIPFANSTQKHLELQSEVFSPAHESHMDYYGRKNQDINKANYFNNTMKVQQFQKPQANEYAASGRAAANFHFSQQISSLSQTAFVDTSSMSKPQTAFSNPISNNVNGLSQTQDLLSNPQLTSFGSSVVQPLQRNMVPPQGIAAAGASNSNNSRRPPINFLLQNSIRNNYNQIPENLIVQSADPFHSKKNRPNKGHYNHSLDKNQLVTDYQASEMLLYQQNSLNDSQESQESAYRKNAFTGINTYKKEIERNKNIGSPKKHPKERMPTEGIQLSQTTKFTMRNEDSRDRASGGGGRSQFGNLSQKNYSKQFNSNGASKVQKPMTAGYDLNAKTRRRNIEIRQNESFQSQSSSKDQKYLCMSKPQESFNPSVSDQQVRSNEYLSSKVFKSQTDSTERSRYQTLQVQQPSIQNPIIEAENTDGEDTVHQFKHPIQQHQQSLEEYSKTAQINGIQNNVKDYGADPRTLTGYGGLGMKKYGSSQPGKFKTTKQNRPNCNTSIGERQRSPKHDTENSLERGTTNTLQLLSYTTKFSKGLKPKHNPQMNGVQRYNMARKYIKENINSKQYWPSGMTHPDDYRVFYWAPDMSFCGFAANHIFRRNSSTKKQQVESPNKMPSVMKESRFAPNNLSSTNIE